MACTFRWVPYRSDARMGLNHQMSSLSCAMNEAAALGRSFLLPAEICTAAGHNSGGACIPFDELFDVALLSSFVPVRLANATGDPGSGVTLRAGCNAACARAEYPCSSHPNLQRRQSGFWYSACLRNTVDTEPLARIAQARLAMPAPYTGATAPSLALLRSGLFYSGPIKAAAREIRRRIGGPYSALHLRRSDKLAECHPAPRCVAQRNASTQPPSVLQAMRRFVPRGATLYVGSTEAAPFFSPLAGVWNLLFASNFSEPLRGVSNNYALYAIESLLFVGADVYMETFGYTRGNFMRSCYPFGSSVAASEFGVSYGAACSWECHEELHLLPPPTHRCRRERDARRSPARTGAAALAHGPSGGAAAPTARLARRVREGQGAPRVRRGRESEKSREMNGRAAP